MFRIDDPSASNTLPTPEAAGTEGYFTEGNPPAGTPATDVRASFLNMLQEELRNIVTAAGLTPSKTTYNQVLTAIQKLMQNSAANSAAAGGTADALTGSFTPAVTVLVNGMTLLVRAASANATTTPTFQANATAAKTIVKGNGLALAAGDIAGAGHWIELQYDSTLDKWVLQNPATFTKFGASLAGNGYQKLPSGLIVQWGTVSISGTYNASGVFTYPIAFPNALLSGVASIQDISSGSYPTGTFFFQSSSTASQGAYTLNGSGAFGPLAFRWVAFGY